MKSEVFGDYAAYYDLLYRDKDYSAEVDYLEQLIHRQRPLANGWKVLDVGSGTGRHAATFARRGHTVVGVDASEQMVRLAREATGPSVRFVVGDARHFRLEERFPVALSLFHVASYQTGTADLLAYFQTIGAHLEPSGLFVFDCWYGPAVLHQKPGLRVRELEDEKLKVLRIARPELQTEDNCVMVEFEVLVERKADGSLRRLHESHRMRYLFLPEIQDLLERAGLELLASEEWMTGKPLGLETWSACLVAGKRS
jgi:SAM-dependent methyltransferase